MDPEAKRNQARRRRGILLGVMGLVLLFAPAISLRFLAPDLAPVALGLMIVGLGFLIAGFVATPRRARPKA